MNSILNIPDSPGEINLWMEELLVSTDFSKLIGQLEAVNALGSDDGLPEVPDDRLADMAANGMASATLDECRFLLRRPDRFIELHQQVFEVGSPYWMEQIKSDSAETQFLSDFSRDVFNGGAEAATSTGASPVIADRNSKKTAEVATSNSNGLSRRSLLTLAASLFGIGLSIYFALSMTQPGASQWGWESAHAMPDSDNPQEYLASLSASGLEWFDQNRGSQEQLVARLEEFSSGCQRLINAPHTALADEDRKWLIEKCQAWKVTIDELAVSARDLDSDAEVELASINNTADDLASKIGLALSRRAESI